MASNFETEHQKRNFFVDSAFLPFQEELDKHLLPFYQQVVRVVRDRDQSSLVTCLTESHLWDSRQLGVHSPMLLIFTMLFFNTKCFRLYTAEQHESLSFASIQKVPQKFTGEANSLKTFSRVFCLQYTPSNENKLIDATVQKQNNLKVEFFFKSLNIIKFDFGNLRYDKTFKHRSNVLLSFTISIFPNGKSFATCSMYVVFIDSL